MKGLISFHPVDLDLFDGLVLPLVSGEKVNPENYLENAIRLRSNLWHADRFVRALRLILETSGPPEAQPESGLWGNIRAKLERFDYRPDPVTRCVLESVEPEIHLEGRPFLIAEGSAERVAALVEEFVTAGRTEAVENLALEQLVRLHKGLAGKVEPVDGPLLTNEFAYRRDLLGQLKSLYDLAHAARQAHTWHEPDGRSADATEVLHRELGVRAMAVHARTMPFWVARDVDGLETVCAAAGVEPPEFLVPPFRLLGGVCEEFPEVRTHLGVELSSERSVGAFVAPGDVGDLLDYLHTRGGAIIRVATQQGEGPACEALLRKIRECATYAQKKGFGYIEAAGILPPHLEGED
jgi:hypothetical protein